MAKCCDGRTGERLCRARCLVPTIIIIVILHVGIWKYVLYPRFFAEQDHLDDEKALYGPGFGGDLNEDDSYASNEWSTVPPDVREPPDQLDEGFQDNGNEPEQFEDVSEFLDSDYDVPPLEPTTTTTTTVATTTVTEAPVADERDLWVAPTENDGVILANNPDAELDPNHEHRHKHRHHKHNRHRYVVKGPLETVKVDTKPWNWPYLDLTTPTPVGVAVNKPFKPKENVRIDLSAETTVTTTVPSTTTTVPTTTTTTTTTTPTTTTHHQKHHHHHKQDHHHHQHHHHNTTTTFPTPWPTTTKIHVESPKQIEERIRGEEARRKQAEAEAGLSAEEKQRIESIYEQQQQVLKRRKQEEARRRHEAEAARRQHAESQRTITSEEAARRRQHEEDLMKRRKYEEEERKRRLEHEERLRAWSREDEARRRQESSESGNVAPVADPWAHLRQIQEQAVNSITVSPITRPPPMLNRQGSAEAPVADPFEITPHEVEGSSGVWRGQIEQESKNLSEGHRQQHHQYHHHEDSKTREALRQAQLEREAHQRRLDAENRRREEHFKLLAEAEARRQQQSNEISGTVPSTHHQHQHQHHVNHSGQHVHHHGHGHGTTHDHQNAHKQMIASLIPDDDITNEISASREKSTEVRSKRDTAPTIVTALMDIGRGEWHQFTRPFDLYLDYLLDLLKLENNIVLFGDSVVIDFVKMQGDAVDQSRLHLVEISLHDLPYYRYRDEIKSIMDSEQIAWNATWERAIQAHPEAINPEYNILVNSKPYLLYNATQISPFSNDKFIWLDAGYSHGQKKMIPHELWNPDLSPGKITAIKITGERDKIVNYQIDHVYRKQWTVMSGGVLAGEAAIIDRFRRFYHKSFMDLLDSRKTDDDQTTLLMTVVNYNSLFNILHGGWFDAFKLLPSTT